jgi:Transcription factor WhiB
MANSFPAYPAPGPVTGHGLWARVARYARCADSGLDPGEWFPASIEPAGARREAAAAIAVCTRCLVRGECLALSLRHWDTRQHGIWGRLIAADRARLRHLQPAGPSGRRGTAGPGVTGKLAPSSGRTARPRPPATGIPSIPASGTPPPARTGETVSTQPAGSSTRSAHQAQPRPPHLAAWADRPAQAALGIYSTGIGTAAPQAAAVPARCSPASNIAGITRGLAARIQRGAPGAITTAKE